MSKTRLDQALLDQGLADSMREATGLILGGKVRLAGAVCDKPGTPISSKHEISVEGKKKYASRGKQ